MLNPDQLKELALFSAYQAMQAQILAAQANNAAEQMGAQVKDLQAKLEPQRALVPVPPSNTVLGEALAQSRALEAAGTNC